MPAVGIAMETGVLVRWLKIEGDAVSVGEPLAEIETDKAVVELESPATGSLGPTLVDEGAEVPIGTQITSILESGDS